MRTITLICSAHREHGLCNVGELLRILRALGPDTTFEEVRPSDFDSYRTPGPTSCLEARAIAGYLEFKAVRRVPVDRFELRQDRVAAIKRPLDVVFRHVAQASRNYQLLSDHHDKSVCERGFSYLQSVECARLMASLSTIEDETINDTGDESLIRTLTSWRHLIQMRERDMVRAIYEYCGENAFATGVFLVGAAHKLGVVTEIERYASPGAELINWSFAYDAEAPRVVTGELP